MEQIRLDLIPNGIMPNVHASQFDKSRTVRFNLYEGDTPFTLLATDNVKVTCNGVEDSTLATAGTSHDWTIPDAVVSDSGIFIGELSVERGSKVIGSKNFVLNVEEDAYNGKNIEERTASGNIANFETNLQDNLTACKCTINPLQSGTGTPSPSNPRPISGFSGANITRCGKNFAEVDNDDNPQKSYYTYSTETPEKISATKNHASNMMFYVFKAYFELGKTYLFHFDKYQINGTDSNCRVYLYSDTVFGTSLGSFDVTSSGYSWTSTYTGYALVGIYGIGGNNATFELDEFMIELGTTATTYEPYNGTTYAISFGHTVYGGVLDVTNGKLTITHKKKVFDGSETWSNYSSGNGYAISISDMKSGTHYNDSLSMANEFVKVTDNSSLGVRIGVGNTNLYVVQANTISGVSDLASWYTFLGSNNLEITYPLATPTEITLTPKQIEAFVGINNAYHDCNGETEVKYLVEV